MENVTRMVKDSTLFDGIIVDEQVRTRIENHLFDLVVYEGAMELGNELRGKVKWYMSGYIYSAIDFGIINHEAAMAFCTRIADFLNWCFYADVYDKDDDRIVELKRWRIVVE